MNNCNYENFIKYLDDNGENNPWEYVADLAEKSGSYYNSTIDYVCEADKTTIEMYNLTESRKSEHKFITNILPVPFEGNVFEAKIIILTLNPGFVEEVNQTLYNLLNENAQKQITDYHIQNLRLQCKGIIPNEAVKFIGDRYWYNKTKELREQHKFELSEIAIIQHIGYQSKEFYETKELKQLKSIEFTRLLLKYIIENRTDKYCFVIARCENQWRNEFANLELTDKLTDRIIVLKNKRNTTLSQANIGEHWDIINRIRQQNKI